MDNSRNNDLRDLIKDSIEGASAFNMRDTLTQDYVPKKLPGREKQLREMAIDFRDLFIYPGSVSVRVVLTGKTGTGKTVIARKFGEYLVEIGKEKNLRIVYAHINCYKQRTLYLALTEVARQINLSVPNRGLSAQELFKNIHDYLEKKKMFVIIVFDEFDYLINTAPIEDIYLLARTYDELGTTTKRINYIFIIRDLSTLVGLDSSIKESIIKNVIDFPPYTSTQLYEILKERVIEEKSFREGAINDNVLTFIAHINGIDTGGSGNARVAIETLELAGKIADSEGAPVVTIDYAKKAINQINPEAIMLSDIIKELDLHQLLILKSIINLKKREKMDMLPTGLVEEEYKKIATNMNIKPRRHTQVFEYIRRLKTMGIIITRQSGRGMRGRTTLISLSAPISNDIDIIITKEIEEKINNEIEEEI